MSELIDREATVKQICKIGEMLGMCHDRDVVISIALFVQDDKTAFPTIEERPHGEWEKYGDKKEVYDIDGNKTWGQMRRCTNCGFIKTYVEDFGFYSICPNCGADMRGGEAE